MWSTTASPSRAASACAARMRDSAPRVLAPWATCSWRLVSAVTACKGGEFSVWGVDCIGDALEILTGMPAGRRNAHDGYPEGTLLAKALEQARVYWERAMQSPTPLQVIEKGAPPPEEAGARPKTQL